MNSQKNIFAHLIPNNAPTESKPTNDVGDAPAQKNVFAHLIPKNKEESSDKIPRENAKPSGNDFMKALKQKLISMGMPLPKEDMPQGSLDISQIPGKAAMDYQASAGRPRLEALQQNMSNVGQGIREIGQGAKQMGLGAGEYAGVVPFGTQNDYTNQAEAQHEQFNQTPAGRDPFGKQIRQEVKDLPFQVLTALPGLGEGGLIAKGLMSGAGGAVAKNIEYRKPGEDRLWATLKGAGEGGALGALMGAPETSHKVIGAYQNIKNLEEGTVAANAAHEQALKAEQQHIDQSQTGAPPDLQSKLEAAQAQYEASQAKQAALKTKQIEGSPEERAKLDTIKNEQAAAAERKLQAENKIDDPALTQALDEAKAEHAANQGVFTQRGSEAKQSPLKKKDVDTMQADLDINKQKITSIDKQLAHQEPVLSPAQFMMYTPAEAATRLREAEQTQVAAKQAVDTAKAQESDLNHLAEPQIKKHDAEIVKADNAIGEHLETGAEHDVRAAKRVREKLDANKDDIQTNGYEKVKANLAEKNVNLPSENKTAADEINAELKKLIQANKGESKEATKLLNQLDKLAKDKVISANEYVDAIQSVNGNMREAFEKGFEPGRNREEQLHWQDMGRQLKVQKEQMESLLEKSIGKEDFKLYKDTSNRWKKEVAPLYDNPVYWQIQKGKMPSDIMGALRGDTEGDILLKNAIKSDPQTLKHVVGQKYDTAAGKRLLMHPDEQMIGYLEHMPDLQKLTFDKRAAEAVKDNTLGRMETQKADIAKTRQQAEAAQTRANDFVTQQKEAKQSADIMNKDYMTKINNIKDLGQQKQSLENMNGLLEKHIGDLKQSTQAIKQSEQKVQSAEKAINDGRQQKLQELNKAKQDLHNLQQQAMQSKGRIELQKRTTKKAMEEEKVSGKLAKQSMDNINRQIKAIEAEQRKSAQQAASERRMTKQKLDKINMDLNKAVYKKDKVISKLKFIGAVGAGLVGVGYGAIKGLKAAGTVASLAGEE